MAMAGGRLGVAAGLIALLAVPAAAGELDRLREENARLQQRVRDLEAENAKLRGATNPGDRGLIAALEERASEVVTVSPGQEPGSSRVETEPSRLEGMGGGKGRHWLIWRGQRPPGGGRPGPASLVVDSIDSGGQYRDVHALQLTIDGAPMDIPVADYRMQINTTGRDTGARQKGESVVVNVPIDTLQRLAEASRVNGKLGDLSFQLSPQQLADVREFAKRLGG
jgi:hypothetical protein